MPQQIGHFEIGGQPAPEPPRPEWIEPPIVGYVLSGMPMRQGKPSTIWHFDNMSKTNVEDWLRSWLRERTYDTRVTIRTYDPRLEGYDYNYFTAVMHRPQATRKGAILQDVQVLFTQLVRAS